MSATTEEFRRRGIAVALTVEGFALPVLDVTHPVFAVPEDAGSRRRLDDALAEHERRHRRIPSFLMRFMLKSAAKRSRLMKAMFASSTGFLDGLSTYVIKLGPDNLMAPYDTPMDRQFASAPHATFMRLRTQQVADLLAQAILSELDRDSERPLHLINIAGGPSIDSLNALIVVARRSPHLLRRPVVIHILDLEEAGAAFGANALAELKKDGFPLHGLDIEISRTRYDWNHCEPLAELMAALAAQRAIVVASSEGGLFEYGSDEAVVRNLQPLRGGAACVVGSVTRADEESRKLIGANQFRLVARGRDGIAPLAAAAGFAIGESRSIPMSIQMALLQAARPG